MRCCEAVREVAISELSKKSTQHIFSCIQPRGNLGFMIMKLWLCCQSTNCSVTMIAADASSAQHTFHRARPALNSARAVAYAEHSAQWHAYNDARLLQFIIHAYRTARNSPRGPRKYNYFSASRGVHREGTSCKDGIASSRQAIIKTLQREQLV